MALTTISIRFIVNVGIALCITTLACTKQDYSPRLVEYLAAEKDLRSRVRIEHGLSDSLQALKKKI
jgi:hypothetical protein